MSSVPIIYPAMNMLFEPEKLMKMPCWEAGVLLLGTLRFGSNWQTLLLIKRHLASACLTQKAAEFRKKKRIAKMCTADCNVFYD